MRKPEALLFAALLVPALPLPASESGAAGADPSPVPASLIRPAEASPALPPAPLSVPSSARPPVQTGTAGQIGAEAAEAFRRGNYEGAREGYRRVLEIEPDNLSALINLGAAEYRTGHGEEAERLLRRALEIKPDNPTAWLNLGILYLERGDPMQSLAAAAQAVVHAPRDPVARNYLGVAAGRNGWLDAAESELRRAVELRPEYADAHFNLAVFCLERDPPAVELARRHYRRALEHGAAPDPLIEKALK